MKVIEFPEVSAKDVVKGLRALADDIEKGEHGQAVCLAWVLDTGNDVEIGAIGQMSELASYTSYLFTLANFKISQITFNEVVK